MTPDQIAALTALLGILERIAHWPLGMLLLIVVIGPWLLAVFLAVQYRNGLNEIRQMYKNNVHLVEGYERLCGDLKDVVILNAQSVANLNKSIEDNQFCPMVRLKKQATGEVAG